MHPSAKQTYRLIDFGDGKKLESIAGHRIVRPCPAATWSKPASPDGWTHPDSTYDLTTKRWTHRNAWPASIDCDGFLMPTQPTPFGHIGVFPEQAPNWQWLASGRKAVQSNAPESSSPPEARLEALNLFAYTGASTMAMVRAGYRVAHVDAAKPNVQAARRAAETNGWADAPIRYLVDDAAKFVAREVRRGRRYHTIVMDPPAYGHGPSGRAWRLERDVWPLIENCLRLVDAADFRMLITGHSAEIDQSDVVDFFDQQSAVDRSGLRIDAGRSQLSDSAGRRLDAGYYVRVSSH